MPDNLNDLVGVGTHEDLAKLVERLEQIVNYITTINGKSINLEATIRTNAGSTSLDQLAKNTEELRITQEDLNKKYAEYAAISATVQNAKIRESQLEQNLAKAKQETIKADNEIIKQIGLEADAEAKLEKQKQASAKTRKDNSAAALSEAKSESEVIKQLILEEQYTQLLTKEKERLENQARKEEAAGYKLQGAYNQLKTEYNAAALNAKNLAAAQGVGSNAAKEASAQALVLYNRLTQIENSVGQYQRNVGNYTSATFALTQILREAPAFAFSFQTGLLAISNNIPILIDEINKLKAVNIELQATGQKQIPIFQTLAKSIGSFNNIITLSFAAITIFLPLIERLFTGTKQLTEEEKKLAQQQQELYDSTGKEITQMQIWYGTATNANLALETRTKAVEELQKKYPDYFANIERETILNGKAKDSYDALAKSIINNAVEKSFTDKIEKLASKKAELEIQLQKALQPNSFFYGDIHDIENNIKVYDDLINEQLNLMQQRKERFAGAFGIGDEKDVRNIKEIKKELEGVGKDLEVVAINSQRYNDLIKQRDKLQKELDDAEKKQHEHTKDFSRERINNQAQLTKDLAAIENQRKEVFINNQEKIVENEKESLYNRLQAQNLVEEARLDIIHTTSAAEIKAAEEKIAAIEKIEKRGAKTNTEKSLVLELPKLNAELKLLQEKQQADITDIEEKGQVKRQQIIKSGITEQERIIKEGIQAHDQLYDIAYRQELEALNERLRKGTVSVEAAVKERDNIENKYLIKRAELAKQYLQNELNSLTNAPEEVVSFLKNLINNLDNQISKAKLKKEGTPIERILGVDPEGVDKLKSILPVIQDYANQIKGIFDSKYKLQIDASQQRIDDINKEKDAEIAAINQSTMAAKDKDKAIRDINARASAAAAQEQQKQNQIKRKQAQADKIFNIGEIIEKTSLAVMGIFASNAYSFPVAIALASAVGAIGAAQLATAIAAPLPQYFKGTKNAKGGLSVVGEKGAEMVNTPTGETFITPPVATLMDIPKGSEVITAEETQKMMKRTTVRGVAVLGGTNPDNKAFYKLAETYEKGSRDIVNAVKSKKPVVITHKPSWWDEYEERIMK